MFETYSFREQGYQVNLFPRYKHMFIIQTNSCVCSSILRMKEGTPYIKLHFFLLIFEGTPFLTENSLFEEIKVITHL